MNYLKATIEKIENSASIKEIQKIVHVVEVVNTWTDSEKSLIKYHANNTIRFLKEYNGMLANV